MFACACAAQQTTTQGQILKGDSTGALVPGSPFACNVDGNVFKKIGDCVMFLQAGAPGSFGGVITSDLPEHIMSTPGLPWDPGKFSGILQLGRGNNGTTCPSTGPPFNCWLTDVPIIIGSGMSIIGSGRVGGSANFDTGTAIVPSSSFPTPLGQPTFSNTNLSCGTPGSGQTYYVKVVEVNNLDTNTGAMALAVPGFSAVSSEASITCASGSSVTVTAPPASGSGSFVAKDYRVFVATASGSETLQAPNLSLGTTCTAPPSTDPDPTYGCQLGGNATITQIQTNGDSPNLVDLSNPLVVEIGPVGGTGTQTQNEGFWALLKNLTLSTFSPATANTPNVAFWDPSDQEDSGLSFVSFTGPFGSTTDNSLSLGGGSWIYIGNHAPNSFVSNVQSDGNPTVNSTVFTGMILDGRPGFGNATGTARRVGNSTFTPGRGGGTPAIQAGILVTGSKALTDFNQVHVETPSGADSNFEVTNGASASVVGPTQFGNTIVHLTSTGTAITVKNVLGSTGSQVVKDDLNGVSNLGTYVANYSSSLQAGTLRAFTSLTLPNQNATTVFSGPSGTFSSPAAPTFRLAHPDDDAALSSYSVHWRDDFMGGAASSGGIGEIGWSAVSGGSGTGFRLAGAANHPGIWQLTTGTTTNSASGIITGATAAEPLSTLQDVAWHVTFILGEDAASGNATKQSVIRMGFTSSGPAQSAPTNGIYWENISTTAAAAWVGVCRSGGVNTTTGTTTPTNLDTNFHRFEIVNSPSGGMDNVTFYIDGVQYNSAVTSGVPTAALTPFIVISTTDITTNNPKLLDVDAFDFWITAMR